MSTLRATSSLFFLTAVVGASPDAGAVCLNENLVSGYHLPLGKEIQSAAAIIVGIVKAKQDLMEDTSDPEGITATLYTLRVTRTLRGKVPRVISIRSENDSGRFPMDVGQEYLLFLSAGDHSGAYLVDSCGNSRILSERGATLRRVEQRAK